MLTAAAASTIPKPYQFVIMERRRRCMVDRPGELGCIGSVVRPEEHRAAVGVDLARGRSEDVLHVAPGERRIGLEHQGDDAYGHRRRRRGAIHPVPVVARIVRRAAVVEHARIHAGLGEPGCAPRLIVVTIAGSPRLRCSLRRNCSGRTPPGSADPDREPRFE